MGEGALATLAKAAAARPALAIPARNASEPFMKGGSDNLSPSPLTIVSGLFTENEAISECKPFSSLLAGNLSSPVFSPVGSELPNVFDNFDKKGSVSDMKAGNKQTGLNGMGDSQEHRSSSFSARYKSMMPSKLPIPSTSAYFTIPPGLSPASLLDSPVISTAGPAGLSPTTGPLSKNAEKSQDSHLPNGAESLKDKELPATQQDHFMFKPHPVTTTCQRIIDTGCFAAPYEAALQHPKGSQIVPRPQVNAPISTSACRQMSGFLGGGPECQKPRESAMPFTRPPEMLTTSQEAAPHYVSERTAADGYKWKKYGQKQLKGTEFPRSYYKCTHPNCSVKKQVECSLEGEVTEIMYKGQHNHAKPHGTRRGARNNTSAWERSERGTSSLALESAGEVSSVNDRIDSDRFSTELSSSSLVLPHDSRAATPDQSFGSPSTRDGEDNEASKADDDGDDEQDSKRKRTNTLNETLSSGPIRTIREPRVVVQTTSEIDILDDGYRWRKYGQKVVKGNRFPRSYYKCTNIGCTVRKHVERSSTDPTSVITAYEGKHNHNVPVARGSAREAGGGPPPLPFYAALGLPMSDMIARPSLYDRQDLGTFVENRLNRGNQFSAGMVSTGLSDFDRNSRVSLAQAMGLSLAGMRPPFSGNLRAPGSGLSLLQPTHPSSSSSCVEEGHS